MCGRPDKSIRPPWKRSGKEGNHGAAGGGVSPRPVVFGKVVRTCRSGSCRRRHQNRPPSVVAVVLVSSLSEPSFQLS
jgi:hypothetical protein